MPAALWPSLACPALSFRVTGRPLASTRACILVVSPPRERPMQSDRPSFFGVAAMLVHPDRGTVDHLDIALISLRYRLQYPRPVTCLAPAVDAVHTGLMRSVTGRDSAHGAPGAQPPEYPVHYPPVIHSGHPANLRRKHRLNHRPRKIRQIKTRHHQSPLIRTMNQNLLLRVTSQN